MLKFSEFIGLHPIFTVDEVREACFRGKADQTTAAALRRATEAGLIRRLKRGIYQARPLGTKKFPPPSPLLVAGRMAHDGVLSHHTAFEALGAAHSIFSRLATYWSNSARHKMIIQGVTYQSLLHPEPIRRAGKEMWGVEETSLAGMTIRVTSRERTFVDGLQGPKWVGEWDEFCHCVDKFPHLHLKRVLEYAGLLQSPGLFSRLGIFLEANKDRFYVTPEILAECRCVHSRTPVPLVVGDGLKGVLNRDWNVFVPARLFVSLKEFA